MKDFEQIWVKFGVLNFIVMVIMMISTITFLVVRDLTYVDENKIFKCFKYINYEYKDVILFEKYSDILVFDKTNSFPCKEGFIFPQNLGKYLIFSKPINVIMINDSIDSIFCKVEYKHFLWKKEYFTYKCFIKKYSPEDFKF